MLFEFDAYLAQVLRADAHVLEHFRIVVRDLTAAHCCPHVVVGNPHFVTDGARPVVIDLKGAAIIRLGNSE